MDAAFGLVSELAIWSVPAFALLLLGLQLLARELGYVLGRSAARRKDSHGEGVGIVVGAMLGLLAFVLALTLSFANARFAERRAGGLAEANAIGTAWLRAEAIEAAPAREIARLLQDYARLRAEFVAAPRDAAALEAINRESGALQSSIWQAMKLLAAARPDPVSVALMTALNEVFDTGTAQRFAYSMPMPPRLFWLLIGLTVVSVAALGFQLGLRGNRVWLLGTLLTLMWTLVIVSILDLASARVGSLRAGAAVYEWTIEGFR